ncbi:MAG: pantoate--beta-alanine ligase [Denitrovibrio sp.]|nr:MAG: pantoate--beta-alanine ligase [Denitrovibrio sp.]
MNIIENIKDTKAEIKRLKGAGKSIGMVPTMGFLHEGHMSLVNKSVSENDVTVVSIFVNPTQFGPNEDLEAYPRDFDRDRDMLNKAGADIIFFPTPTDIYPENYLTTIKLTGVTENLCGLSRPGHFDGVSTIVCKLFNIMSPDRAYFGSKDYQQLQVIKSMVRDLNMDVEVIGMPIIREADGLALSSRNVYLKDEERGAALSLSKSFNLVESLIKDGERDAKAIRNKVIDFIHSHANTNVDYVELVHPEMISSLETIDGDFVLALAVKVGKARLIDNKYFTI